MKKSIISFIFLFLYNVIADAVPPTVFSIEWDYKNLPFTVELAQSYNNSAKNIGEMGILGTKVLLPPHHINKDGKIPLEEGESSVLILLIKNNSDRKISFSVSPHSTHPAESSLGFYFNCLCNGHIYKVGPKQTWYRIMKLSNIVSTGEVVYVSLKHEIYEVKAH